jgi:hypothetical protein
LAVAISSLNSTVVMPAGLTMPGVPFKVMPTKPTGTPSKNLTVKGGRCGSPSLLLTTFAAR